MSRVATLVRSLLIVLLLAQSFSMGAMEARAALGSNDVAKAVVDDDTLPPCHRAAADVDAATTDEEGATPDCCSHGACRCLGLMLALPQVVLPTLHAEALAGLVVAVVSSRLPPTRLENPLRPPSV